MSLTSLDVIDFLISVLTMVHLSADLIDIDMHTKNVVTANVFIDLIHSLSLILSRSIQNLTNLSAMFSVAIVSSFTCI